MKKLLCLLLISSSLAYADNQLDCSAKAEKVVNKLAMFNRTSVTLNYSADQTAQAKACQAAIQAKNPKITVALNQVDGTNKLKFSK